MTAAQRRNAVAATSNGLPTVAEWLVRIESLNDAALTDAVRGIWCGSTGEEKDAARRPPADLRVYFAVLVGLWRGPAKAGKRRE